MGMVMVLMVITVIIINSLFASFLAGITWTCQYYKYKDFFKRERQAAIHRSSVAKSFCLQESLLSSQSSSSSSYQLSCDSYIAQSIFSFYEFFYKKKIFILCSRVWYFFL